jgi:hypothetical protein
MCDFFGATQSFLEPVRSSFLVSFPLFRYNRAACFFCFLFYLWSFFALTWFARGGVVSTAWNWIEWRGLFPLYLF